MPVPRVAGYHASYRFICASGHQLDRVATNLMHSKLSSPKCKQCEADVIRQRCLSTVAQRGGTRLGTFTGLREPYRVRCAKGHEWKTSGSKISEGRWCPQCKHEHHAQFMRNSDRLQRLQAAAEAKGGRCLGETYLGAAAQYLFACACGHRWNTEGSEIVRGHWCPPCSEVIRTKKISAAQFYQDGLERLQEAARRRNGECLTKEYLGAKACYRFRCAARREWTRTASHIWAGNGCRPCAMTSRYAPIKVWQALAASRDGRSSPREFVAEADAISFGTSRQGQFQSITQ
jgi:hypothetical protein